MEIFCKRLVKQKLRRELLKCAKPLACTLESVGVCHARPKRPCRALSRPVSYFLPACSRYLPRSDRANHLSLSLCRNSADLVERRKASTLVCHTCMWDPQTAYLGPPFYRYFSHSGLPGQDFARSRYFVPENCPRPSKRSFCSQGPMSETLNQDICVCCAGRPLY